jgi:hypothetical protein
VEAGSLKAILALTALPSSPDTDRMVGLAVSVTASPDSLNRRP